MNQRNNNKTLQNIFSKIPCFKKCGILILTYLLLTSGNCAAQTQEISEIFIEASGNNKYEAKIKAHEKGMFRSLSLLINKLNLPTEDIKQIPYYKLKSIFTPISVQNELSSVDKYSATVTYSYSKENLYQLILEYGGSKIHDQFYEFLIIPVFKQKNVMNIWDNDKRWNDKWISNRQIMDTRKIFYPTKNLYISQKITPGNLLKLNLEEYVNIFHNVLFKNVMIVTAELFTNRKTADTIMQVKKYILRPGSPRPEIIEEEYNLSAQEDIPRMTNNVINKILDKYGSLRSNFASNAAEAEKAQNSIDVKKPIIMNFDVFDEDELKLVTEKLKKVGEIERFEIKHDQGTRYKIHIYTTVDEFMLAESLYLQGLSYKIHGELYNLIDIKKGG